MGSKPIFAAAIQSTATKSSPPIIVSVILGSLSAKMPKRPRITFRGKCTEDPYCRMHEYHNKDSIDFFKNMLKIISKII